MKIVGKGLPKIDGMAIATGKPLYTEDMAPPGALVVKVLHSPHAYARITAVDAAAAVALPGVEAVYTYKDVPQARFTLAGSPTPSRRPMTGSSLRTSSAMSATRWR